MSISICHPCIGLRYTFTIKYFAISILNGSVAQSGQGADFLSISLRSQSSWDRSPSDPLSCIIPEWIGNPYMSKKFIRFTLI